MSLYKQVPAERLNGLNWFESPFWACGRECPAGRTFSSTESNNTNLFKIIQNSSVNFRAFCVSFFQIYHTGFCRWPQTNVSSAQESAANIKILTLGIVQTSLASALAQSHLAFLHFFHFSELFHSFIFSFFHFSEAPSFSHFFILHQDSPYTDLRMPLKQKWEYSLSTSEYSLDTEARILVTSSWVY